MVQEQEQKQAAEAPVPGAAPDGRMPVGTPFSLTGLISAYKAATSEEPGTITIGGLPFPIAAGTTFIGDSIEPDLRVNLDARLDAAGRISAGTVRREVLQEEEQPSWDRFWLQLAYLVLLISGALIYHDIGHDVIVKPLHDFLVALFPDPIGSVPISVIWLGALGSVVRGLANSYGEVDLIEGSPHRPRHYNTLAWYVARPFIGAAFGIFVFIFFLTILDPIGNKKPGAEYGMDILAFVIGYADGTFAALVQRTLNVLLGPGDPHAGQGTQSGPSTRTENP